MSTRTYISDIAGGTATVTIQMQEKGTLKQVQLNGVSAAAGSYEVSLSPASQIGTAAPTADVICRQRISGTAGAFSGQWDVSVPIVPFQSVYVHCTGAANVGEANLIVA